MVGPRVQGQAAQELSALSFLTFDAIREQPTDCAPTAGLLNVATGHPDAFSNARGRDVVGIEVDKDSLSILRNTKQLQVDAIVGHGTECLVGRLFSREICRRHENTVRRYQPHLPHKR